MLVSLHIDREENNPELSGAKIEKIWKANPTIRYTEKPLKCY